MDTKKTGNQSTIILMKHILQKSQLILSLKLQIDQITQKIIWEFFPTAPKNTPTKATDNLFKPINEVSKLTKSIKETQNNNTHEIELNHDLQTQIHEFLEQQKQDFLKNNNNNNNGLKENNNNNNNNPENNNFTQKSKSPKLNVQTKKEKTNNNIDIDYIKICTHNTRGINKQTDQDNILQECKKQKIDILGLCETKLINNTANFSFKD